jgi:uncharacterized protein (DUF305 family)
MRLPSDRTAPSASCRLSAATLLAAGVLLALPEAASAQHDMSAMGNHAPIVIPAGAGYTKADVEFMQGMIAHHGQAIYMSRLAAGHQADPRLQKLATKIDQSQVAEIRIMQDWLSRRGQFVPDTSAWRTMMMPGMLNAAQLDTLNAGQGTGFDRAYLTYMIQHHEGALQMVRDLFATSNAGQEVDVNVFANDVVSVQTAEIGAMRRMLEAVGR